MSTAPPDTAGAEPQHVLAGEDVAQRVVRGGALRVVGFVVVNLLGVAGSVVLLRHLGVADFGRYGAVLALIGIVSGIADAGLTMTGSRELALLHGGPERRRLLSAILGVRLLLSTLAVLGALVFAVAAGYDRAMLEGVALAGAGAILVSAQTTLTLPLIVELRNGLLSVSEIVKQAILLVGIVALAVGGAALVPFFAVQVLVGLGALAVVPLLVARDQLAWPTVSRDAWRRLALKALPVALASVLTVLYVRVLVVIASVTTSEFETGLFVTSARIVEMLGGLAMLFSGVILPVVSVAARDDRGRLRYVLRRTSELCLLVGALIALVVVVAARPIVVLLGGAEFAAAAPVLRLQAPVVLTIFLVYPWTSFLIADGRSRDLVRCVLVGLVSVLAFGITLIALFDARGAALAAVAADLVLATTTLHAVRGMVDGMAPVELRFLARFAVALGAAAGVALLALTALPAVVAAALAAAVFALAARLLHLIPSELLTLVPLPGLSPR